MVLVWFGFFKLEIALQALGGWRQGDLWVFVQYLVCLTWQVPGSKRDPVPKSKAEQEKTLTADLTGMHRCVPVHVHTNN